jgi:hypothetical protein
MKKLILTCLFGLVISTNAQVADSLKEKWIPSLVTSLGINQIAFSNWVKGGDNSISWTFLGDFHYDKIGTPWTFKNQAKLTYGRSKIGSEDYRTTDNDLYIENVASYDLGWAVSPFLSNSIRTQVASGFDYKVSPYKEIANIFDPGYITQTIGFTYDKYSNIITRLGVGFQEIITNKFNHYSDDPDTKNEIEKFKFETGLESVTDVNYMLAENIAYAGKLRFFSQFKSLDVWDIRFDNMITAKVTKFIAVNLTYLLVYEQMQSPYTQVKEGLQIGITYTVF